MKWVSVWIAAVGLTTLAGCSHVEPSQIVTAFHNAGGGDIDDPRKQQWLAIVERLQLGQFFVMFVNEVGKLP